MEIEPEAGETDGFPALDFKFYNRGHYKDLLTKIIIDVRRVVVDYTPVLNMSIGCDDGDVMLYVTNDGWGVARDFRCEVDLTPFGAAVPSRTIVITEPQIPTELREPHISDLWELPKPTRFELVNHQQIDALNMPSQLLQKKDSHPNRVRGESSFGPPQGGLDRLSSQLTYTSIGGRPYSETRMIRTPRYDKIYFQANKFKVIGWDPMAGVQAMRIGPSYRYHFLLDPDNPIKRYEKSIAHEVRPDEYERIWIVLASKKSAHYELKCRFLSASGRTIESSDLELNIWSPRSYAWRYHYGRELANIAYPVTD